MLTLVELWMRNRSLPRCPLRSPAVLRNARLRRRRHALIVDAFGSQHVATSVMRRRLTHPMATP